MQIRDNETAHQVLKNWTKRDRYARRAYKKHTGIGTLGAAYPRSTRAWASVVSHPPARARLWAAAGSPRSANAAARALGAPIGMRREPHRWPALDSAGEDSGGCREEARIPRESFRRALLPSPS